MSSSPLLPDQNDLSDEDLYQAILSRVNELLDTQPDLLFSYMYRLDVLEHRIKDVIERNKQTPLNEGLAQLILERQKERINLRKQFQPDKKNNELDGWSE